MTSAASSSRPTGVAMTRSRLTAFLEAAGLRLAAMESTDRPAGPLVSDALLVAWAEWADSTTFSKPVGGVATAR